MQEKTHPFIVKVDSSGNLILSKIYNYPGMVRLIKQTNDGKYIMGINFTDIRVFLICKYDSLCSVVWTKSYFRPDGVIIDLIEKPNGNLILTGSTDITYQTPVPLLYIMEMDSTGNVLWTKTYGDSTYRMAMFGITHGWNFLPIKIKQTHDSGFVLVTTLEYQSNSDIVLTEIDSLGNLQWERRHGDSFFSDTGIDLIQTQDSGYFVVGGFYRSPIQVGYYLLKTDLLDQSGVPNTDPIQVGNLLPTDSNIIVIDSIMISTNTLRLCTTQQIPRLIAFPAVLLMVLHRTTLENLCFLFIPTLQTEKFIFQRLLQREMFCLLHIWKGNLFD